MSVAEPAAPAAAPPPPSGGGAPPGASAGGEPSGGAGDGNGGMSNHVSGVSAGGDVSIFNNAYHIMESQRRTTVRRFTFEDGRTVTEVEERHAVEHFVGLEGEAEGLVRHLEERRVLLLTGPAGARKVTAATGLALRLKEAGRCTREPLIFDPVDRRMRMEMLRLPEQHDELRDRVVIFRTPLSRGNPHVADAFTKTDPGGWVRLQDTLRERNAFLVFTASDADAEELRRVHALQRMHRTLSPHSTEVRIQWLGRYLDLLRARGEEQAASALAAIPPQLLERFSFGQQLGDFVTFFHGLGDPELTLEQAYALFQDHGKRLVHDQEGDDWDRWSFVFTLRLAHCTPDMDGVPWVDFDRLRRHLRRWLTRDLQLTDGERGRREEEDGAEPSDVRVQLSDDTLLTRSRARVTKDPVTLADMIHFSDGSSPRTLWRDLLQQHRRVLTAILPRLRELAERPGADGNDMSVLAAQIIGRIGEMDYDRVVVPMAERWAGMGGRAWGLVGAMFDGVLASEDARFRVRCLQHLRSMHTVVSGTNKGRVEAAVAACSWVGYHNPAWALGELFAVCRAHLVPMIEDDTRVLDVMTQLQAWVEKEAGRTDGDTVRAMRQALRKLVDNIYKERGDVFLGVQYALVSLCRTNGVVTVLRELRGWIGRGGASMGVLIALMFLHEKGMAGQLGADRTEYALGEGIPPASCGLFVRALGGGDDDLLQCVRFLGDLNDSVTAPWATAGLIRQHFRDRLQAHLLEWVEEGLRIPDFVEPVRRLLEQLARTHEGSLRELVVQVVNTGEFARKADLRRFAAALRL